MIAAGFDRSELKAAWKGRTKRSLGVWSGSTVIITRENPSCAMILELSGFTENNDNGVSYPSRRVPVLSGANQSICDKSFCLSVVFFP